MAKEGTEPLRVDKGKGFGAEPINEEVLKGVLVDSFGLGVSEGLVILDGIVSPPRSGKDLVVSRVLFPPKALVTLQKTFSNAIKEYEKEYKKKLTE